ncbi:MAG: SHOCT domain-containing protein [Bdellovibrionales bacterium]|nr:SHOCT domain-containing protein [Bdellovibrionales bacterium]
MLSNCLFNTIPRRLRRQHDEYLSLIEVQYQKLKSADSTGAAKINSEIGQARNSIADEIAKLHKLKQDGALSDQEFQAAKKKLVG